MSDDMYCYVCGNNIDDSSAFCPLCGAKIRNALSKSGTAAYTQMQECPKCKKLYLKSQSSCPNCGNRVDTLFKAHSVHKSVFATTNKISASSIVGFVGSLITSIIMILMILTQNWLDVAGLFSFSFSEIIDFMENISQIVESSDSPVIIMFFIIIAGSAACVIMYVVHIIKMILRRKSETGSSASILYIILAVVVWVMVAYLNNEVHKSYGMVSEIFEMDSGVFFICGIAIVNMVFSSLYNKR